MRNFQGMQGGPGAFHQMPQHQRPMAVSSMTHMIQPGQHAALNEFELRQRDRFADAKEVQPRAFNENFHLVRTQTTCNNFLLRLVLLF